MEDEYHYSMVYFRLIWNGIWGDRNEWAAEATAREGGGGGYMVHKLLYKSAKRNENNIARPSFSKLIPQY